MLNAGDRASFLREALGEPRVIIMPSTDDLECNISLKIKLSGSVYLAHGASAN
jgi:hypothetical protein